MKEIYILGNIPHSSVVGYRVEKAVRGRVVPRNGFTGEVRLSSSAGTLEGDRILLGPGPSPVKLRLSPGMTVKIQATDNRGRGLKEGALEVRVNDPAPAPRVTTWTIKENSEVPFDPGSLAQPSLPSQVNTFYRSEVRAEVRSCFRPVTVSPSDYSNYHLDGGPLVKVGVYGEVGEEPLFGYGILVDLPNVGWTLEEGELGTGIHYLLSNKHLLSSARGIPVAKADIAKYRLYEEEPGFRPWAEGKFKDLVAQQVRDISDKVEIVVGKNLKILLSDVEQGRASLQDVRTLLVAREGDLREAVRGVGGRMPVIGTYYWDARSRLFLIDPSGSEITPWKS